MGSLLVITGPPGSGKSAVSARLAEHSERSALVAGDAFFGFLRSGRIDPWLAESADQNRVVITAAAAATGALVRGGYDTIYDGVLGPWFLDTFASGVGEVELDYAILLPPVETCVQRIGARTDHAFADEAATRRMHDQFAASAIAERHVVPDEGGIDAVVDMILERRDRGLLLYVVVG